MNGEEIPVTAEELEQHPSETLPEKPSLEGMLTQMIAQLNDLKADNQALRREQVELRSQLEQGTLAGPGINHTSDPNTPIVGDERYARHVTLITRPVQDNPGDYKYLVSTSDLRLPG